MQQTSRAFFYFSCFVVVSTIVLIWWGAAVTTEGVGMAVPGWPLSFGKVNPEGWTKVPALLLEHGHRLIASLVGTLVLIMFIWQFVRSFWNALEVLIIVGLLGTLMGLVQAHYNGLAITTSVVCLGWLAAGWTVRKWTLLVRLTATALILVSIQAVLGGIRVLHISDLFGTFHGFLGQVLFCLLLAISLAASRNWENPGIIPERHGRGLRIFSIVLFSGVLVQLFLGALVRHFHRFGLADEGILTTGGGFFPGFEESILVFMFFHKWWAVALLAVGIAAAVMATKALSKESFRLPMRLAQIVATLLIAQLTLGVLVIVTGKSFWITNFHVLNGLAILAFSFIFLIRTLRAQPGSIPLARS